ncbi:phospholipase A2 group XV-like isoform X2 [Vespula pensylvanica]|uniref:phospholipase A2 group XV-like isoform X2 n=1 Tax=Vespula pensylvanica TaxID=30213 RepID=UPI001CBA3F7B|nr:phospholipase A2 group XV-like isoform X2 [Vespula pensylvanica]
MRSSLIFLLVVFFSFVQFVELWNFREQHKSPIILIPGDGGSQLEAKLNKTSTVHYLCEKVSKEYFNIWLNLELLVPVIIDCWIDNMKLIYDNVTRTTRNQDGVDIRIPNWGDPFIVEYLDPSKASPGAYFKDIGNMLVDELGYIRNISLRGAPYDFRKGPSDDLGAYLLRESILKDEQITSPSLGWLLPSKLFWKENEVLVETENKNYTLTNLQDFLIDINVPNGWEFRKDNEKYQLNFTPPGVVMHCLYGKQIDTLERLYYKPGTSIDGRPQLIPGDGDGTVNLRSLEGCLHWQMKQKQKVYHQAFPGVNHMTILKHPDVLKYIKSVLTV